MERRRFLTALAGSVAGAVVAAGCTARGADAAGTGDATPGVVPPPETPTGPPPPPPIQRFPVPGGAISVLPGDQPTLLLGIDDGVSTQAVLDYCTLVKDADLRLVFFANGCYDSWAEARPVLAPLVESGRVQLANHTYTHPNLTQVSSSRVASELRQNAEHFHGLYGVDLARWYRPPYGAHNATVDSVTASEGYHPPVVWADSFVDWAPTSTEYYVQGAERCFQPRAVVLGHANKPDVTPAYPAFVDLIRSRGLRTVTLDDVFYA